MAEAAQPKRRGRKGGPSKARRDRINKGALAAWRDILAGRPDLWPRWEPICTALRLCRDDAMRQVGLNPKLEDTPRNHGRYNAALKAAGLQDVYRQSRKTAIEYGGYLKEIAAWREDLRRSPDRADRQQYLALQHPQKVWADFGKCVLGHHKAPKASPFANLSVKNALALADSEVATGLAANLPAFRLRVIAAAILERLPTPMRPQLADAVVLRPNATWQDILAAVATVRLADADRSKLADALTFAAEDAKRRTPAVEIKELVVRQGGATQPGAADDPHQPAPG